MGGVAGLSIGEVAKRAGLRPSALRYYEQVGLLAPQLRANGRRAYAPSVLDALALIAFAKRAGFTIAETRRLIGGFQADVPAGDRWRELAQRKEQELDALIARATAMKHDLQRIQGCPCQSVAQCGQRLRAAEATSRATSSATVPAAAPTRQTGRRRSRTRV